MGDEGSAVGVSSGEPVEIEKCWTMLDGEVGRNRGGAGRLELANGVPGIAEENEDLAIEELRVGVGAVRHELVGESTAKLSNLPRLTVKAVAEESILRILPAPETGGFTRTREKLPTSTSH